MAIRKTKGSVSVQAIKGRLRLQWQHQGQRYFLSLGYPDLPEYHRVAQSTASEIESDILYGRFDVSLRKYQGGKNIAQSFTDISIGEIWDQYCQFKSSQLKPSTKKTTFAPIKRAIEQSRIITPSDAPKMREWALCNRSPDSARRMLVQLNAACKWAVDCNLIESNPFNGLASKIRTSRKKSEDTDIDPFTTEERDLIIAAFETSYHYKFYAPLVKFLFSTGCRPSEALGLQWRHISKDCLSIKFEQACTQSEEGMVIVGSLKTQQKRVFPCNVNLQAMLKALKVDAKKDDYIFPSVKGKLLDFRNFNRKGWTKVLQACGIDRKKPYQMRHTFITLALENGVSPQDVAKLVGTSPKMIYQHYAGVSRFLEVPVF